jgi:hypothetical protein
MSLWDQYQLEDKVKAILDVRSHEPGHHFGRPFLTPYQVAVAFATGYPLEFGRIGKPVGGQGQEQEESLAHYIARQIAKRTADGRLAGIEGRFLHRANLHAVVYALNGQATEPSSMQAYDLPMFRLVDPPVRG